MSLAQPLGYVQITLSALSGLNPPAQSTMALISCSVASIRWRDDGVNPTASVGMPMNPGQEFQYSGDMNAIKFIAQSGTPVLDISFYRA
jgi:hypothetical protein